MPCTSPLSVGRRDEESSPKLKETFGEAKIEVIEQDTIRTTRSSAVSGSSLSTDRNCCGEARRKRETFNDEEPALTARIRPAIDQRTINSEGNSKRLGYHFSFHF
jgi:hypothetical protein